MSKDLATVILDGVTHRLPVPPRADDDYRTDFDRLVEAIEHEPAPADLPVDRAILLGWLAL